MGTYLSPDFFCAAGPTRLSSKEPVTGDFHLYQNSEGSRSFGELSWSSFVSIYFRVLMNSGHMTWMLGRLNIIHRWWWIDLERHNSNLWLQQVFHSSARSYPKILLLTYGFCCQTRYTCFISFHWERYFSNYTKAMVVNNKNDDFLQALNCEFY